MGAKHYKEKQTDTFEDGKIIDLDSYDWGGVKLLKKQKLFIVWYTLPNQSGFLNATAAALKAGYKRGTAYNAMYNVFKSDMETFKKVRAVIQRFLDDNIKSSVADACNKIMMDKIRRATYDVGDFYEAKEIEVSDKDSTRSVFIPAAAKSLEEIPKDKRELIDNVEVSNSGIVTYKLPNREREAHELLEINAKLNAEKNGDGYDVETTIDLIKENLATVKTTVRLGNQRIKENAENYIEVGENQPDFD